MATITIKGLFLLLLFLSQNKQKGSSADTNDTIKDNSEKFAPKATPTTFIDFSINNGAENTTNNKRPKSSNIINNKPTIKDEFGEFYNKYYRNKRNLSNLRKQLNEDKKKEKELMPGDAVPRMEPNYPAIPAMKMEEAQYGGINTEQVYNKKNDKIRQLRLQHNKDKQPHPVIKETDCDFEDDCNWTWRKDIANGFYITSGSKFAENDTGPRMDASGSKYGSFLLLRLHPAATRFQVDSPVFDPTSQHQCRLEMWIYQELMEDSHIRIICSKNHSQALNGHTQWVVDTIPGDNSKTWTKHEVPIGKKSENFSLILEVVPTETYKPGATIAFDNISLTRCYPELGKTCTVNQYRCELDTKCVNSTSVCDIKIDCASGDDERQNCDMMPYGARCTFEEGWCGWYNVEGTLLEWSRHNGSTPTNDTGPNYDHTYKNNTGKYLYVSMLKDEAIFASRASLKSVVFNPPPRVHGNISSRFYNSCAIRFYFHQTGKHKSGLGLQLTELRGSDNVSTEIFWSYGDLGDKWIRQDISLPNITHKYYLHFDVKKGIRFRSDIAIDDVSLSPECFGLNIPDGELQGYNYWNPVVPHMPGKETHNDFINETYYQISTCGAKGRFGPKPNQCAESYNDTRVKVKVLQEPGLTGVQKWVSPHEGYYTFILNGASGGKGSGAMGSSRGATVRTVLELRKGQEIYILVGQEGMSACVKSLGSQGNSSCLTSKNSDVKGIRGVLYMEISDGGGGGGGGTFVFLRNRTGQLVPLMAAAGGGGLGWGRFVDTGRQHGQAINMSLPPLTGRMYGKKSAGAGGGWRMFPGLVDPTHKQLMGKSIIEYGGIGGKACYNSTDNRGDGGFGAGGGGCSYGGGGGGYVGGDASSSNSTNGEGGYSFIDSSKTIPNLSVADSGYNAGPGSVVIIPAINGCGCEFKCVALDARRSHTVCICPENCFLGTDGKSCLLMGPIIPGAVEPWLVILLIILVIFLIVVIGIVCFMLYNRYQLRSSNYLGRKPTSGAEMVLGILRPSDGMISEYNPNYEFGGAVYTLKDLKDIPRDQLRLVKALGQGAFGEVYQGFYRQRPCDTVEMPVAVKTLPEMSTSQAEMDFLMEALIMSKFSHPNIVHFIGVCFDKHPRFIVLELLSGGDLKNFLRESRPKPERGSTLTMKDLIMIAVDVAKGCKYLEDNRFIHRDIAARNCLLTTKGPGRVVKIADFGMSRDVYRSDYYRKGGKAMLPIKWMPPEAFLDGIFSSKTDVWSFGVLLWEIMSMGYMPYTGCSNREVMQLVTTGGRLDPPANCPGPIYGIMTQCWHPTPEQRPTFSTILERMGYCHQDPQVMTAPLPVFHRPPSNERDTTVMRPLSSDENCLQVVPQSSDYLVPNHTATTTTTIPNPVGPTSSIEKLLPDNSDSWETSFIMPQSRSTQPLLLECDQPQKEDDESSIADKLLTKPTPIPTPPNHNNNIKTETSIKSGISLDASALAKQSNKYNGNLKNGEITSNGIMQNGPVSYLNSASGTTGKKYPKETTEIHC